MNYVNRRYWVHCVDRFTAAYPITMAKIAEDVKQQLEDK